MKPATTLPACIAASLSVRPAVALIVPTRSYKLPPL
jgi:hypothetical protein